MMKPKLVMWMMVMMVLVSVVSAQINETYVPAECPTDSLPNTLMFIFFGLLIIGSLWYSDNKNFGLGLLITAIALIFYSLPLYGCGLVWGLITTCAGLLVGVYAWKWKYY